MRPKCGRVPVPEHKTVFRGDAEKTAPTTPHNTDRLVAILLVRPESGRYPIWPIKTLR
jgi:hypothetical protein